MNEALKKGSERRRDLVIANYFDDMSHRKLGLGS
jgi:hypothetical protein